MTDTTFPCGAFIHNTTELPVSTGIQMGAGDRAEDIAYIEQIKPDTLKITLAFSDKQFTIATTSLETLCADTAVTLYDLYDNPIEQLANVGFSALWNQWFTDSGAPDWRTQEDYERNLVNMAIAVLNEDFDRKLQA